MTMNKILLVLIVSSGFLLIFYANNDIFTRKKWINIFQQSSTTENSGIISNINRHKKYQHQQQQQQQSNHHENEVIIAQPVIWRRHNTNNNNNNKDLTPNEMFNFNMSDIKRIKYIPNRNKTEHNIFVIYTKENSLLKTKFEMFVKSLLKFSSIPLHLHIISDGNSEQSAEEILRKQIEYYKSIVYYTMYDVEDCAHKVDDITKVMLPYFSSSPGSYYSDALFFLSLGLHRIVDVNMRRAILIDCDVVFRSDVSRLFDEFEKFSPESLFGLAPELTPVYHHVSYKYRAKYPNTNFGKPYYPSIAVATAAASADGGGGTGGGGDNNNNNNNNNQKQQNNRLKSKKRWKHGYPGLNSGVVLLDFDKIRHSKLYSESLKAENVMHLAKKYYFKGHLGDQDFYTLLGYEFPSLIYRLDCIWNRQLCQWWKERGYSKIFDSFFHCDGKARVYHGNCNTRVPEE